MKNDLYIKGIKEEPSCSSAADQPSAMPLAGGKPRSEEKMEDRTGNPLWYDHLIDIVKFVKSKRV